MGSDRKNIFLERVVGEGFLGKARVRRGLVSRGNVLKRGNKDC